MLTHLQASSSLTTPSCKLPSKEGKMIAVTWKLIFLFICLEPLSFNDTKNNMFLHLLHVCHMYCMNALTCFLLLPGNDGALATKAHPVIALTVCKSEQQSQMHGKTVHISPSFKMGHAFYLKVFVFHKIKVFWWKREFYAIQYTLCVRVFSHSFVSTNTKDWANIDMALQAAQLTILEE